MLRESCEGRDPAVLLPQAHELAERVQDYIREQMPVWKVKYEGVETLTLAVMGCVVNGPGESKAANIGISLPGTGEAPTCPVFIDGEHHSTLRGSYEELAAAFQQLVDDYVDGKYARKGDAHRVLQRERLGRHRRNGSGTHDRRRLWRRPDLRQCAWSVEQHATERPGQNERTSTQHTNPQRNSGRMKWR